MLKETAAVDDNGVEPLEDAPDEDDVPIAVDEDCLSDALDEDELTVEDPPDESCDLHGVSEFYESALESAL